MVVVELYVVQSTDLQFKKKAKCNLTRVSCKDLSRIELQFDCGCAVLAGLICCCVVNVLFLFSSHGLLNNFSIHLLACVATWNAGIRRL